MPAQVNVLMSKLLGVGIAGGAGLQQGLMNSSNSALTLAMSGAAAGQHHNGNVRLGSANSWGNQGCRATVVRTGKRQDGKSRRRRAASNCKLVEEFVRGEQDKVVCWGAAASSPIQTGNNINNVNTGGGRRRAMLQASVGSCECCCTGA